MKTTRTNLSLALMFALTMVVFTSVNQVAAQNQSTISKTELKVLLKTAKTPTEHQKIATYYRQEAARLNQSAKEHGELAAIYKQTPPNPAMESKHGVSVEGASHCNRWAELDSEQAKEAEALAVLHEGMAKAAEQN
jgi:hypothetical protein